MKKTPQRKTAAAKKTRQRSSARVQRVRLGDVVQIRSQYVVNPLPTAAPQTHPSAPPDPPKSPVETALRQLRAQELETAAIAFALTERLQMAGLLSTSGAGQAATCDAAEEPTLIAMRITEQVIASARVAAVLRDIHDRLEV